MGIPPPVRVAHNEVRTVNAGRIVMVAAVLGLAFPTVGRAQGFGRNKVQYETLPFQVLHTEHFQVFFLSLIHI